MPLYVYLLLIRKELDCQAQDVEGVNSTLQVITGSAPNIRIGFASDRIQVKAGQKLTPAQCVGVYEEKMKHQESVEYRTRFNLVTESELADVPGELPHPRAAALTDDKRRKLLFAGALFDNLGAYETAGPATRKGAAFAYVMRVGGKSTSFVQTRPQN